MLPGPRRLCCPLLELLGEGAPLKEKGASSGPNEGGKPRQNFGNDRHRARRGQVGPEPFELAAFVARMLGASGDHARSVELERLDQALEKKALPVPGLDQHELELGS